MKYHLWPAQYNHLSLINGEIMNVSKGLYVCIKRTDTFYTHMDKPTRTLVSARCKGVNERRGPEF